ncbi:hypothetical protein EV200_109126 [Pedobacter psychrotolerans]|uniref:Uncharacterized protein n=1 Tax=Pedobacter psychrotolerans TaxID=1843235 RepID=A0A4R2H472_9SPHI|nr:hypothetical protein [Pedobacter psychrotolerans]TCO19943.1 hypothetical protein EV200_109126 [Pedobacter psychrotolerans]GGE50002.1 hypothetical protein GCM10011413_15280 [Pedobacter psychrotolerans]
MQLFRIHPSYRKIKIGQLESYKLVFPSLPDGTEFIGKGIKPDIKEEYTIRDLLKNEDSVLMKAIDELKSNYGGCKSWLLIY